MIIWVLGRSLPKKSNGFQGTFEFDQAKILANYGCEVFFLDSDSATGKFSFDITEKIISKVHVITISVPIPFFLPNRLTAGIYRWSKLLSFRVISGKFGFPDIIHIHYPCQYIYFFLRFFQKNGCRIVVTEHWSKVQMQRLNQRLESRLKQFVQHADSFICVSDLLKKAVIDITNTKREIRVIPNILPSAFCKKNMQANRHEGFNFIAVGRLDPIKHFDFLISVFAKTFSSKDNVRLTIIGAGEQESILIKLIEKFKCADRVILAGYVKPEDLRDMYLTSDALIVTSKIETFCLPIAEAMACGLPVISTSNVGAAEFINDDRGIITDYDNAEQLSNAMRNILQTYNTYNREEIQKYAFALFHPKVVARKLLYEYGYRTGLQSKES